MKKTKTKRAGSTHGKTPRAAASMAESASAGLNIPEGETGLRQALSVLNDPAEALAKREEALRALQSASFGGEEFDSIRGDYVAALRGLVQDKEIDLRQRALGLLARSRDPYAEKVLVAGLRDPEKAPVPAGDALHYLSYNPHSGVQSIARTIFDKAKDPTVRQQALRLMANDPKSLKTIRDTLADKKESDEIRQTSAVALHALDPKGLQNWASKVVLDKSESPEVVATCLTALHEFGDEKNIAGNVALRKRLGEMTSGKSPAKLKRLAKIVSSKYGL